MRRKAVLIVATASAAATFLSAPTAIAAGSAVPGPNVNHCNYEAWYDGISNQGRTLFGVGPTQANYNGTSHDATSTFSAQISGTVGMTINASVSADAGIVLARASASTGVSLSASLTASLGNSTTVTTSPGRTAYATYGVWRLQTYGTYHVNREDCSSTATGLTAFSPWYVGWNTWSN
ncbi:hypothetical protein [Kitasatospora sp. MMS16-BH015]|uniref:hypothetical protein n=1 Tax=Kitasatospora sp. MMS16-BH015 TaxID=2018025 RepID=UPI000CF22630|nr:hypothetical protein [Kitasatospora sp. MMS16-BH015]